MIATSTEKLKNPLVDVLRVSPDGEFESMAYGQTPGWAYGLQNATAEGGCSWFEFAREILALTGTNGSLKVAGPSEFPTKVLRPKYSVLENRCL